MFTQTILERLQLAFPDEAKRSVKAAIILVNIESLIPASYIYPLPSPSTSEERMDFISFILKKETNIDFSPTELLVAHNVLLGSGQVREQLSSSFGIEKLKLYLHEYRVLQPQSSFARSFSPLFLLPHRNTCNICHSRLNLTFQGRANVIYCTRIEPCLLYKADCYTCRRSYRVSSIYSTTQRSIIVTPQSQKADFIHFSGSIVFAREFLISFSCHLIKTHSNFTGFASASINVFNQLHPESMNIITTESLGRMLQCIWIYHELGKFIFMATSSEEFSFPCALSQGRTIIDSTQSSRAMFFERNLDWIYHVFTTFWSHHRDIFGDCKSGSCSEVLVLDGHQKPRRLVCRYENVTSLLNVEELGPINKGCPYMPTRRNSNSRETTVNNDHYYCEHHRFMNKDQSADCKKSEEELLKYLNHLKTMDREESNCNVGRNDMEEAFDKKKKSMGFICSFMNCGIIIGFSDSVNHEGPRKITDHLLTMMKFGAKLPSILVYDAACQLHKFWQYRFQGEYLRKTIHTQQLMDMKLVSDRFHNTIHNGLLCKTLFNPDSEQNKRYFVGINTSVAEQTFSYLAKFKCSLRSFAYPTSAMFTILLFHLKNCDKLNQATDQHDVAGKNGIVLVLKDRLAFQNYCLFETLSIEKSDHEINEADDEYVDDHEDVIFQNEE